MDIAEVKKISQVLRRKKVTERRKQQKAYQLTDIEEIIEYMWLKPRRTGLAVDIFVDDGGSYKLHEHQLLVLVRNGYDVDFKEFIPVSVQDEPYVMDADVAIKISPEDLAAVYAFIRSNMQGLISLADCKITQEEFIETLKKV